MGSSEYHNIKKKQLINAIKRLARDIPDLEISQGTKHYLKLRWPDVKYGRPTCPLAINSCQIDGAVVQELMKWLGRNKIFTKEKFDQMLKK